MGWQIWNPLFPVQVIIIREPDGTARGLLITSGACLINTFRHTLYKKPPVQASEDAAPGVLFSFPLFMGRASAGRREGN